MILYHGSKVIVQVPVYGKGRKENDYGRGFYCTQSIELAKEWACPLNRDGFVNKYSLDTRDLKIVKLTESKFNILNWLALLLDNRRFDISQNNQVGITGRKYIIDNFMPDLSGYDVIVGYRADDRYFAFAKDFVQNGISVRQLSKAMKLGELGEQVVLVSQKAFEKIHFVSYEIAESNIYYYKRVEREIRANEVFSAMHMQFDYQDPDIFILDILREGIKNNDSRLR